MLNPNSFSARNGRIIREDGNVVNEADLLEGILTALTNGVGTGTRQLSEQKTQADAVSGTVTFSKPVSLIEILNLDEINAGVFNVNGFDCHVPKGPNTGQGTLFAAKMGGTPRTTVQVSGSTSYILTTYE
ncbi:hypothetical protein [Paenibacillus sp. GCM10012303]|uniref:hypothetical protein n=1 Tax=Paenibacillus sp. GCM10012303 TaxID=3317340 RepID=UPI00360B56AB